MHDNNPAPDRMSAMEAKMAGIDTAIGLMGEEIVGMGQQQAELAQQKSNLNQGHQNLHQQLQSLSGAPAVYRGPSLQSSCKMMALTATVDAQGVATFNVVDEHGAAFFSELFKEASNFWVDDASRSYTFGSWALSPNKKTVTVTVRKTGQVLTVLGIDLIGAPVLAVGSVVNATFWGV